MSKIQFSEMVNGFKTGIFATLNEKKEELLASGKKIYNLSVGTPDFPVFDHIRKALVEAALADLCAPSNPRAAAPEDVRILLRGLA